jgi:hypothetical protein
MVRELLPWYNNAVGVQYQLVDLTNLRTRTLEQKDVQGEL